MANMLMENVECVLATSEYGRGTTRLTVIQRSGIAGEGREYWTYVIQGHLIAANKASTADDVDVIIERLKS